MGVGGCLLGPALSWYPRPCCIPKKGPSPSEEWIGHRKGESGGGQEKGREEKLGSVYKMESKFFK